MTTNEIIQQAQHLYYSNGGNLTKIQCAERVPTPDAEDIRDVCNLFDIDYKDYLEGSI